MPKRIQQSIVEVTLEIRMSEEVYYRILGTRDTLMRDLIDVVYEHLIKKANVQRGEEFQITETDYPAKPISIRRRRTKL